MPSLRRRARDHGSSTTSGAIRKRMVARRSRSYFGQPQSPSSAKATQAACMVSASGCEGLGPVSGSVASPRVSKTNGTSRPQQAPSRPLYCGDCHANSYAKVAAVDLVAWASANRRTGTPTYESLRIAAHSSPSMAQDARRDSSPASSRQQARRWPRCRPARGLEWRRSLRLARGTSSTRRWWRRP